MKILTIGNSFSDDMMEYVWHILTDLGLADVSLGNLYIPGCSLSTHADNAKHDHPAYEYRVNTDGVWHTTPEYKLSDALQSQEWDIISMQQASHDSGLSESYNEDLDTLIAYVKARVPRAKLVWHMTWAYAQNSDHGAFPRYHCDQQEMYRGITNAVQQQVLSRGVFDAVVPSGTTIQNARSSSLGDNLTRDGYHLSIPLGRYMAGLTMAQVLTGKALQNVAFCPDGVSEKEKQIAQTASAAAIACPFGVTTLDI